MKVKARHHVSAPKKHSPVVVGMLIVLAGIGAAVFVYVGAFVIKCMPRQTDTPVALQANVSPVTLQTLDTVETVSSLSTTPSTNSTPSSSPQSTPSSTNTFKNDAELVAENTSRTKVTAPKPKPKTNRSTIAEAIRHKFELRRKQINQRT